MDIFMLVLGVDRSSLQHPQKITLMKNRLSMQVPKIFVGVLSGKKVQRALTDD